MKSWLSSALNERHYLDQFDCGVPELNRWLTGQASRAQKSNTARTYVWTATDDDRAMAYFAIAPHQARREEISGGLAGGVTIVPVYLIA